MKKYLFIGLMLFACFTNHAQVFNYVVDKNGSADFTSIQEAINAVSSNNNERTLIFVKNGTYYEKVQVSTDKINVSLIGQDAEKVRLTYDDNPQKGTSPADTYTMLAGGNGLYVENMTIENSSGDVGQAIAIRTTGDTMAFKNCHFNGFQDTYYAHKNRQYNLNCTVKGATDFIYGDATAVFDSCTVNCVKGGSYISAPADTKLISWIYGKKFLHGLLFRYCNVTADDDVPVSSYYLGRPWQPDASSVYISCVLGRHIKAEGWSTWSGDNHLSAVFAEYQNKNEDGSLTDISQRAEWSSQLDSATVASRYKLSYFLRKNGKTWDPLRMTLEQESPNGVSLGNNTLSWNAVDNAIGYVVFKTDSVLGFTSTTMFEATNLKGNSTDYQIKSVTKYGALSLSTYSIPTGVNGLPKNTKLIQTYKNGIVNFSQVVNYQVFTLSGVLVDSGKSDNVNIQTEHSGMYIVQVKNNRGETAAIKIMNQ
ncbi:pectinesterase family protein [uncultured Draconibacterium sp.]|uniref:pectinesterase family protein n=1 Tax=uncultured Draconibacterium sp. TaxID=1573823 RepID=UPI003261A2BA